MSKAKFEPGEGFFSTIGFHPSPALNASHFGHPLPQGERVRRRRPGMTAPTAPYPFNLAIATPSRAS